MRLTLGWVRHMVSALMTSIAVVIVAGVVAAASESQAPTLRDVLAHSARYVDDYRALLSSIDANGGRVLRSLLRTDDGDLRSEIEVTYGPDSKLGLWVPVAMREQYRTSAGETIEGTATYGGFRQFNVETSERTRIR